ncbi:hypothetical protein Y032_0001g187 [Ancylostoma ceylanicum]|uniref:Uncharacterized protein n=1 Tax=Ancylostoma ceylanicum TaxID=53326 RepID=A0A016W4Q4_9BILA|nr:hypothetical protein Y032_0001g187 [Ancylostoma ceylanicum]
MVCHAISRFYIFYIHSDNHKVYSGNFEYVFSYEMNVTYSALQTVVEKGRDRDAGNLVVCGTKAVGLLGRDTEKNRAAVLALVCDRLEFTAHHFLCA